MKDSTKLSSAKYFGAAQFCRILHPAVPAAGCDAGAMALSRPARAISNASLTLRFSVLGGLVGYLIGAFLFDLAEPFIIAWGYQARFEKVITWFDAWGFWAVLVAGFSPVPYKIFTIAAGVLNLAIIPFVLASIIGRGARFFLLAWCLAKFGPAIESRLVRYIEFIGWAIVAVLVLAIGIYYLSK